MSELKQVLAIIPARGGSKGVPGKNIKPLAGRPLIAWTVEAARSAHRVNRVIVSTDDGEIAEVARACGAEVVQRPEALSGDTATSESALFHVLETLRADEGYVPELVAFLQCTSPVRRPGDVDAAIETLLRDKADSLLSVARADGFYWTEDEQGARSFNYDYHHRPRHQDLQPMYRENGSIYVTRLNVLTEQGNRLGGRIAVYEMGPESISDIDTPADFEEAERWMKHLHASESVPGEPR